MTITETIPAGTVVAGVSTSPSAGLLVSSDPATGTAVVTVVANGETIVTITDAATPVAGNGFVQVCKVAGAGVAAGTNFTFSVAGTTETIAVRSAPGGTCGTPVSVPAGTAMITETIPAGTLLAGIGTSPSAGLLVSSNLAAGNAMVTVVAGQQTTITLLDVAAIGTVQVCKVAGTGVAAGTNFSFNVAGTPQTIAAGPAPVGTCGTAVAVPAGPAAITETLPAGILITGLSNCQRPVC